MIVVDIAVDTSIKAIFAAKSCRYVLLLYTFTVYDSTKPFYHYINWLALHTTIRYAVFPIDFSRIHEFIFS